MIESLRRLIAVHELDVELDRHNEELSAFPGQREAAQAARLESQESVASAKQALSETELEQRRLEGELSDQESLVERLEAQVYEVKTSEAYRALQTETALAKQAISERETRILELLDLVEEQQAALKKTEKNAALVEARSSEREAEMTTRESELSAECDKLKAQRGERCQAVDAAVLSQYERVVAWNRPALVVVDGAVCTECRMAIPRQRANEIQAGQALFTCGGCQRILIGAKALAAGSESQ